MSYSIYIGNTTMRPVEDEEVVTAYARLTSGKTCYYEPVVKEMRHPNAPTFPNDEMTGNSNGRHPGYRAWAEFCEVTGLEDLFFNREHGLMREHPGHAELHLEHVSTIHQALLRWQEAHPDANPGFERFSWDDETDEEMGYDPILARLIWLEWWMTWALANCEHAGIWNY